MMQIDNLIIYYNIVIGDNMLDSFKKIKKWAVEQVLLDEEELESCKTRAARKKLVADKLLSMITLPWYLSFLIKPIIKIFIYTIYDEKSFGFSQDDLNDEEIDNCIKAVMEKRHERAEENEPSYDEPRVAEKELEHTPWQIPWWSKERKPVFTKPTSEEESQRREINFQKSMNFVLKFIEKKNFNIVNSEPVIKENSTTDEYGPISWGISIPTLKTAYLSGIVKHWNIGKLTKDEAKEIYRKYCWNRYGWGELAWPLCMICLDLSINRAGFAWIIQKSISDVGKQININGKFGAKTFNLLKQCDPYQVSHAIIKNSKKYYESYVKNNEVFEEKLKIIQNEILDDGYDDSEDDPRFKELIRAWGS